MNAKITDLQKIYLDNLKMNGPQTIGSHAPMIKRSFDALVAKGRAICTPLNPGWYRYTAK